MTDTNKREAPAHPTFTIDETQMHLASLMSDCKVERNEATNASERMFCDGRILLLHELHLYLEAATVNASYTSPVGTGRWELEESFHDPSSSELVAPCSVCHTHHPVRFMDNYCPHCGTMMGNSPRNPEEKDG